MTDRKGPETVWINPADLDPISDSMSLEEFGAFTSLVILCWTDSSHSVPRDREYIVEQIKLTEDECERLCVPIMAEHFDEVGDGRIRPKILPYDEDHHAIPPGPLPGFGEPPPPALPSAAELAKGRLQIAAQRVLAGGRVYGPLATHEHAAALIERGILPGWDDAIARGFHVDRSRIPRPPRPAAE